LVRDRAGGRGDKGSDEEGKEEEDGEEEDGEEEDGEEEGEDKDGEDLGDAHGVSKSKKRKARRALSDDPDDDNDNDNDGNNNHAGTKDGYKDSDDRHEPAKTDKQKQMEDDWGLHRSRSPTDSQSTRPDDDKGEETDTEDEEDARVHVSALYAGGAVEDEGEDEDEEYDYEAVTMAITKMGKIRRSSRRRGRVMSISGCCLSGVVMVQHSQWAMRRRRTSTMKMPSLRIWCSTLIRRRMRRRMVWRGRSLLKR
jgi:hypothetical protein